MRTLRTMRLKTRLTLAFLAVASLLLVVGLVSYWSHRGVRGGVAALRPSARIDLEEVDLAETGLELEGFWSPDGVFVATEVSVIPRQRRPRLRGAIQAIDRSSKTVTVYGVALDCGAPDHWNGDVPAEDALAGLRVGDRVDVTCEVDAGRWVVRKLHTADVKASDKIKATAALSERSGGGVQRLDIHGLPVVLASQVQATPESSLKHLGSGIDLTLLLQELRDAGYTASSERLSGAVQDLRSALVTSGTREATATSLPWLQRLVASLPELERLAQRVAAIPEPAGARLLFTAELVPFLDEQLEPLVTSYLAQSREDLGDDLAALQERTATTLEVALATTGVATLLALGLGLALWRSVRTPLLALGDGARRIGGGDLDARVAITSSDELGELAMAFNDMASRLASTTLSIGNLEEVFDSMAAALLVLDERERVVSANRACLTLLNCSREDLVGARFEELCPPLPGGASPLDPARGTDGLQAPSERELARRGGPPVPVSFSAAAMRTEGSLRGYVCVAQDLTERKRIESQVRSSLAEKELLLREVHHRVKNNMQVISSMLAMQSSLSSDPSLVRGFEESQSRIRSMALIHEQLYQSADLSRIDLRVYLTLLTSHLAQSFGAGERISIELDLLETELNVDASLAVGLIVNELVSNAFKHAFPNGQPGTIRVSLASLDSPSNGVGRASRSGGSLLELAVHDDGAGDPRVPARSGSLGLSLVGTLAAQLGGGLETDRTRGTRASVVFPRAAADQLQPA